ncbi:MAG: integral membrane sensor signal transduction histidine kinase [uncultured bacterium]|nr:MAG: integral membrane sensor signal transduction histidine kinase [uncultured bacterium]
MKKKKSIKIKLIQLFLIMGIIPSILIMSIMYFGVSSNLEQQTGNNLKLLAFETSLRVNMFIQNKVDNVLKYSTYSTLKRIFFPGSSNNITAEFIRSLFKFDADLQNISLIDNKRNTLFSYKSNIFAMQSIDQWWNRAVILEAEQFLLLVEVNKNDKEKNLINIIIPLTSDLNKKKIGIMLMTFSLSSLVKLIENIPSTGSDYIALIDKGGNIISSNLQDKTINSTTEDMPIILTSDSNGWILGFDGITKTSSLFGFSNVSTYNNNSCTRNTIHIYVSHSKKEAFKPILWLMIKLLALCFGVVFLILVVFIFRIETIWKPIISMKKGAEMIGEGNFDMVLFIPTEDELEDLANSFNKMGKNLKSSREKLEEQNRKLLELNNVKNNFLSMVSHELRTPLMIIKEALSQILEGIKGPVAEEQKDFLNMAWRNTGRLNQIIQDLLCISKIETGKMEFNRKKTDIISLVKNEIINQSIKSATRQIELVEDFDGPYFEVYCDPEKVQLIFTNLLGNAIKFNKQNSKIETVIRILPDEVNICVRDNGPGIPKDSLVKIFERFVRLNPTPLVGAPSTGLGLAIAKELVQMHDGEIWAESDGVSGSSFYFTLPRYAPLKYLEVFFNDRLNEAVDKKLEVSIIHIRISDYKVINNCTIFFNELRKMSLKNIFAPLEIVHFEDTFEIFMVTFADPKSLELIKNKINNAIKDLINSLNFDISLSLIKINHATHNLHGKNFQEILEYLQKI